MDDGTRWQALDALFHGALERAPAARAAFLDAACPDDAGLRAEVEAMVAAVAPERALAIERFVPDDGHETAPDPIVGMRLGAWRVLDVLAHGGMGTVYLAERADGQYGQHVALKLVPGAAGSAASARFTVERAALARLAHPNIAHLIDAGHTPEGSPYLVMEYVDGEPLTAACDRRHLTVAERLRLFAVVCDAIQHAHQALVVHRDLKPSNIFVTRAGDVKVLDFGIAKLLEPDADGEATDRACRALTPAYAAPEQIRGGPITTAADVYVLGAVLSEVLTGSRPPPPQTPDHPSAAVSAPSRIVRALIHDDAAEARARIATAAHARRTTPARLARTLSDDIDRVVLKAMEREPARRYASAGQLADDLRRVLAGRPVHARPDSVAYRTRRFLVRHRWGAAAGVVFALTLLGFGVGAVRQSYVVAAERDRAERQAYRAERVSRLLADLFALAGPAPGRGEQVASRELLDQGAARIASELAGDSALQAELFTIVGRIYGNLSLHARGVEVLERALALESGAAPHGSLAQAETLHRLGDLLILRSDFSGAEQRLREALALRRSLGAEESAVADTLVLLGRALGFQNAHAAARPLLEEALAIRHRHADATPEALMAATHELGMAFHRAGDLDRAALLFEQAVDYGRRITEPVLAKVEALLGLARLLHQFQNKPRDAEPVYREALALSRSLYPADHQDIAVCLGELARDVRDQGRLNEAEALARDSVAMFERLYGGHHRESVISTQTLASIQREQGRLDDAETTQRRAFTSASAALGPANPLTLGASRALAAILEAKGRFSEAFALRSGELQTATTALGDTDVYVAIALAGLGAHCLDAGRPAAAVPYLRRALAVRLALHPPGHRRISEARAALDAAIAKAVGRRQAEDAIRGGAGLESSRGSKG